MKALLFTIFTLSLPTHATIYGEDSFVPIFGTQSSSSSAPIAHSVGIQVSKINMKTDAQGNPRFSVKSYEAKGICKEESFAQEYMGGTCTGTLIAPNLLLTAGHCYQGLTTCENTLWAFPKKLIQEDQGESSGHMTISKNDVAGCKRILSGYYNPHKEEALDYALIELDRPLKGRTYLDLKKIQSMRADDSLYMYSYPRGTSLKYSEGNVRRFTHGGAVANTNIDAMMMSSGAPVFSKSTGNLVGLLIRGDDDLVGSTADLCNNLKRCENDQCRGEDVAPIHLILKHLKTKGFIVR